MSVQAIVHTQGVVLNRTYYPLELAYVDALGVARLFLINSPLSYTAMRIRFPKSRPDVVMTMKNGVPYEEVVQFLRTASLALQAAFPHQPIVFGYKGASYQPQVLRDAGISNRLNLETLGVPPLRHRQILPPTCFNHRSPDSKCAWVAIQRILCSLERLNK